MREHREHVVLDIAGAVIGGAASWAAELDGFVGSAPAAASGAAAAPVTVIGRGRRCTPAWLVRRERHTAGARIAVAANNVAFAFGGAERRVVLRNALHFLHPAEAHLLARMPRSFRAQIPLVRALLARADTVVVPSSAMAERVCRQVPAVGRRLVVRPHPVTPVGPRQPARHPFILVPVLPAPYKNLVPQLARLLAALDRTGQRIEVRVTAGPADLPAALARHPRLTVLGTVAHHTIAGMWRQATAAFFPSTVEAFGYPLAEARAYGVPVLSPDTGQAREIAGAALRPYRPDDLDTLVAALGRIHDPVTAEPYAFDRDAYFRWLFGLAPVNETVGESHDIAT
jgi:glycosyltransferase involved in cell wall biosynthesis